MAPPHVGDPDAVAMAGRMGVDLDELGYVLTANKRLKSFASRVDGIFVAGSAQGEKDVAAAASQAAATAGAVLSALVPGKKLVREAATAVVDDTICGGCQVCVLACPYKAISFDAERKVRQRQRAALPGLRHVRLGLPVLGDHGQALHGRSDPGRDSRTDRYGSSRTHLVNRLGTKGQLQ